MSQPNMPTMSDAPASLDAATLDSLFPADPVSTTATTQPTPAPPPTATTPTPNEPFIKGNKTVYKTREEAIEGVDRKDALIDELRQRYSLATGIDPITQRPLAASPQASDNYATNPQKWFDDLSKAKDAETLAAVQSKFFMDTLQPYVPTLAHATKTQAMADVKNEIPDFENIYKSPDFKATLDATPSLREAIETAEGNVKFHSRLPDLYKTAYLVHQGIRLPELLKQAAPTNTPTTVRTTNNPTSVPPPDSGPTAQLDLSTPEGRKAIIAQAENTGLNRRPW